MQTFRAAVIGVRRLSPDLIRITLGLPNFPTTGIGDEYVRIYFPQPAAIEPPGVRNVTPLRSYTIRAVRADEIDIDFVLHDGGVAATWAQNAHPGDVIGLNRPTAHYDPPADLSWQLLACDLTGLPAAARLAETAPPGVRTRLIAEVPDPDSVIDLAAPRELHTTWIFGGNGRAPSRLAEAVRAAIPPERSLAGGYVWAAGPTNELRGVRRYLRKERGLGPDRYKVVGYWTPNGEAWRERFYALPGEVRTKLWGMWRDEREHEDIRDDYESELERLGL